MPQSESKSIIKITVLGTGTSSGVPTISCQCPTCTSEDVRDKRLRCSLLIESDNTTIVVDTTPDFRQQMLRYAVKRLDAVVFTHHHFDHIGGFDDIRAFNYTMRKPVPIYLSQKTYEVLSRVFIYAFEEPEQIGGGVPLIDVSYIDGEPFTVGDITLIPVILYHGKLEVYGFRIRNFAYCTDTNNIPLQSMQLLHNLDYLILDALRYSKHSTHYNLEEAIAVAAELNPKETYFTHIAHQIKHAECEASLPDSIRIAYDDMVFNI